MWVSSTRCTGFDRSRPTPRTSTDIGDSSTLAAGLVVRSSTAILASRSSNRPSSNCQGALAAAVPAGTAVAVAGAGAGARVAAGAGVATGPGVAAGTAGAAASASKLMEPSGSRQAATFTPLSDSESTCARRFERSTLAALKVDTGTLIQSRSEFLGRTVKSVTATFEIVNCKSTASFRANRYAASTSILPELTTKLSRSSRY